MTNFSADQPENLKEISKPFQAATALAQHAAELFEQQTVRTFKRTGSDKDTTELVFAPAPPGSVKFQPSVGDTITEVAAPEFQTKSEEKGAVQEIEVGLGTNDLSAELGKGAKLVRGGKSDLLTLSTGHNVEVKRDTVNKDGLASIAVKDSAGKETANLRIGKTDAPVVSVNDGAARSFLKITPDGQIGSIRTNGKTYKLVAAKFE